MRGSPSAAAAAAANHHLVRSPTMEGGAYYPYPPPLYYSPPTYYSPRSGYLPQYFSPQGTYYPPSNPQQNPVTIFVSSPTYTPTPPGFSVGPGPQSDHPYNNSPAPSTNDPPYSPYHTSRPAPSSHSAYPPPGSFLLPNHPLTPPTPTRQLQQQHSSSSSSSSPSFGKSGGGGSGSGGRPNSSGAGGAGAGGVKRSKSKSKGGGSDHYGVPIHTIKGHVLEIAVDQTKCRELQHLLLDGGMDGHTPYPPSAILHLIFEEVAQHAFTIVVNPFGNYLFQKIFELSSTDQRAHLLHSLLISTRLADASCNKHGSRCVQQMIKYSVESDDLVMIIIQALSPHILRLCVDENGNHVVQYCLDKLSIQQNSFIFDLITESCLEICKQRYGNRVMQKCIKCAAQGQCPDFTTQIVEHAFDLITVVHLPLPLLLFSFHLSLTLSPLHCFPS
jgi:hypothetical protein